VWAGAAATTLVAVTALLVAAGVLDRVRAPSLRISFGPGEPWCRRGNDATLGDVLWVRVGVENVGRQPARGCLGRLIGIATDGVARTDVDPVQLRWAGLPRSRSFEPLDLRRGQREFLNVLVLSERNRCRIVTFEDEDFDPGFPTEFPADRSHDLQVAVFADNANTAVTHIVVDAAAGGSAASVSSR
jgi:hypothetical protein